MQRFQSKVGVVTGASNGIGLFIAEELAAQGMSLGLFDLNQEELGKVNQMLSERHPEAKFLPIVCDVSNQEQVNASIQEVVDQLGRLDYLVNNAGINGEQKHIAECNDDIFRKVMEIDFYGTYYCLKAALKHMEPGSAIVNIASILGLVASRTQAAYVSAKHAVVGLTQSAALDLCDRNIRVNGVAPGAVLTPMVEKAADYLGQGDREKGLKIIVGRNPMGRAANGNEIAQVVAFLLSDEASYMTGQILRADAGQTISFS
ncbi:MAG: SDR family oxidoreductase [Eubacteriales bacterium]|nr:SDR family oxidoreductase [Eubacteriales bacterium]